MCSVGRVCTAEYMKGKWNFTTKKTEMAIFHVVTQVCFDLFDTKKVDFLSADDLGEIMRAMGFRPTEDELKELLAEIDEVK